MVSFHASDLCKGEACFDVDASPLRKAFGTALGSGRSRTSGKNKVYSVVTKGTPDKIAALKLVGRCDQKGLPTSFKGCNLVGGAFLKGPSTSKYQTFPYLRQPL